MEEKHEQRPTLKAPGIISWMPMPLFATWKMRLGPKRWLNYYKKLGKN